MYPYGIINETEQLRRSKAYGRMLEQEWRTANWSDPARAEAHCPGRMRRAVTLVSRTAGGILTAIARRLVSTQTGPQATPVRPRHAERSC